MHESALSGLEESIDALHKETVGVAYDHWEQILAMEKRGTGADSKSSLQLFTHRKGNHIQAKWVGTKWYGVKTSRKSLKVHIPKLRGDASYSIAKLKIWCKDWEVPIVEETERKLSLIRRQSTFVVKAIIAIRSCQAIALNNPIDAVDLNDEESDEIEASTM